MRHLVAFLCCIALPGQALALSCSGTGPPWSVKIDGEDAVLTLANEEKPYNVRLATGALNDPDTVVTRSSALAKRRFW